MSFERNETEMLKRLLFSLLSSLFYSPRLELELRGETTTRGWGKMRHGPKTWFALHKIMHETAPHLGTSGSTLPGTQPARWIPKTLISRGRNTQSCCFLMEIRPHHPRSLKNNTERDLEATSVCSSAFRPEEQQRCPNFL